MDSKHREQLIEKFSNLHGASGFEAKVRDAFIHEIEQLGLEYEIDHLGNVIGNLSKKNKLSVLIMAHMDEVGFLTEHVDEQGFIRAVPLGRWDEHILWDKEWLIHVDNESIVAYSGMDPPHISNLYNRKPIDIKNFFLTLV